MAYQTEHLDNRPDRRSRQILFWQITRPILESGSGREEINRFLGDFTDAYRCYLEGRLLPLLEERYQKSSRGERMEHFPYHAKLSCLCREMDSVFSTHFSAEIFSGAETVSLILRSFVWDSDSGNLLRLSDLSGKTLASARSGWSFYLASDGLRLYRTDRHGKVIKREKYPT